MHLRKIQTSFFDFEKDIMTSRLLTKKKKKDHDNKNIKNMFQQKYIDNTW